MLDLLLVHPGAAHGIMGGHQIYGDLGNDLIAVEPPLWCRLIAGFVRDMGHSVKIIDAEALRLGPVEVAEQVAIDKPRLVCIAAYGHQPSASTQQMTGAGATARALKEFAPSIPIIMVGGHVSALPVRTLDEEDIDFACEGEGPITIAGLLDDVAPQRIPGLVWRTDRGVVKVNTRAELIPVAQLRGDAWDLLPMDRYKAHNWQCFGDLKARKPYASIYTSLGCPYQCAFCCINAPFGTNEYRMRNPRDVVDEIADLRLRYGVRTFKIVDEMFVLNKRHYTAIAQGLIDTGWAHELNIWAYARVDTVADTDGLNLLRRAGFQWLALGVESGSAHVRDGSNKRLKNNDIADVVARVRAAGINVIANYIFGLPDDDMASMQETLTLACMLNTEFANFYSAMAYPGSKLYDQAVANKWTLPKAWRGYSQHNDDCRPLDTAHVPASAVLAMRDHAFNFYFQRPEYLDMVAKKFGPEAVAHVRAMTRYKLTRKLLEPDNEPSRDRFGQHIVGEPAG